MPSVTLSNSSRRQRNSSSSAAPFASSSTIGTVSTSPIAAPRIASLRELNRSEKKTAIDAPHKNAIASNHGGSSSNRSTQSANAT